MKNYICHGCNADCDITVKFPWPITSCVVDGGIDADWRETNAVKGIPATEDTGASNRLLPVEDRT